jgi:hypothetical protein
MFSFWSFQSNNDTSPENFQFGKDDSDKSEDSDLISIKSDMSIAVTPHLSPPTNRGADRGQRVCGDVDREKYSPSGPRVRGVVDREEDSSSGQRCDESVDRVEDSPSGPRGDGESVVRVDSGPRVFGEDESVVRVDSGPRVFGEDESVIRVDSGQRGDDDESVVRVDSGPRVFGEDEFVIRVDSGQRGDGESVIRVDSGQRGDDDESVIRVDGGPRGDDESAVRAVNGPRVRGKGLSRDRLSPSDSKFDIELTEAITRFAEAMSAPPVDRQVKGSSDGSQASSSSCLIRPPIPLTGDGLRRRSLPASRHRVYIGEKQFGTDHVPPSIIPTEIPYHRYQKEAPRLRCDQIFCNFCLPLREWGSEVCQSVESQFERWWDELSPRLAEIFPCLAGSRRQ